MSDPVTSSPTGVIRVPRLRRAMRIEKPPYLFALVIGLLSWVLVRLVDRVTNGPALTYSRPSCAVAPACAAIRIENISENTLLKDVLIVIRTAVSDTAKILDLTQAVGANTPILPMITVSDLTRRDDASVTLPEFQPGWSLSVTLRLSESVRDIQLTASSPTQAVRLVPNNVSVFAARYESAILLVLTGALTIGAVAYGLSSALAPPDA